MDEGRGPDDERGGRGPGGRAPGSRERILAAAAALIAEDGATARLSVRAVASRAGVSVGSLRHHFPTQQALRDEVMRRVSDWLLPESELDDDGAAPHDRLVARLRRVLDLAGTGADSREAMTALISSFVAVEPSAAVREAHLATQRDSRRRLEGWLGELAADGALPAKDVPRAARFLETVLNGLALQRALPAADGQAQVEAEVLDAAVDAVLAGAAAED